MNETKVKDALIEFGAERFVIRGGEGVIVMEKRDHSRVRSANGEEWVEFCNKLRRSGWKIEQREHIPLPI